MSKHSKITRLFSLCVTLTLLIGLLCGCNNHLTQNAESTKTVGGYSETELSLPKPDEEGILKLADIGEGKLAAYTIRIDDATGEKTLKRYPMDEDGNFGDADVTYDISSLPDVGYTISFCHGKDQKDYILYGNVSEGISRPTLYRVDEKGATEITIPYLQEKTRGYYPSVKDILVLNNGLVVIQLHADWIYRVFNMETGEQAYEFTALPDMSIDANDDGIFAITQECNGIIQYDLNTGAKKANVPINFEQAIKNELYSLYVNDKNAYIFTNSGIYSFVLDGNITTCLFDGQYGMLSTPKLSNILGYQDRNENFYILYTQQNDNILQKYTYDETLEYGSKGELTIYSLDEDDTIRQAIVEMKKQYPDVQIKYIIASATSDSSTKQDWIKSLNTELLSNEGADVMVCDGLPVDDYVDKGIFADITELIEKFMKNNQCFTNVTDNYKKDGKYYTFPSKFAPCFYLGKKDVLENADNLEKCMEYKKKNNGLYGSRISVQNLFTSLYEQQYENITTSEGMLDEAKAAAFLNSIKDCQENGGYVEDISYDEWLDSGALTSVLVDDAKLIYGQIIGQQNLLLYDQLLSQTGTEITDAAHRFVPRTCVGINKKSKQKELAEHFLEILLSSEVQSQNSGYGIPVNRDAYEKGWADETIYYNNSFISCGERMIESKYLVTPDVQERYRDLLTSASVPVQYDVTVYELLKEQLNAFISGSIRAEDVVKDVNQKVSIYLKE